jgi:MFS family permease
MLAAIGPIAFCLALMAFMPSLWTTALLVFAFFFAYYVYEPPYRGLYPDLLPESIYGRAQSVQHVLRGIAMGGALVGGGFLFHVWHPFPFLVAALATAVACLVPILWLQEDGGHGRVFRGVGAYLSTSWQIVRDQPDVRRFLIANSAWEGAFAAARTFVVLYIVVGLGQSTKTSALVLACVAGGYVVAAMTAGALGDRIGLGRTIFAASFVYGFGLLCGGAAREWHDWYYALIVPVAIAGGMVMTLAWGLLFKLMPPRDRGAISGLATMTKGFGLLAGPVLVGGAIDILQPSLGATHGYQVLWPICSVPVLAAIPLVWKLHCAEQRRS